MRVHLLTGNGMAANCDCPDFRPQGDALSSMAEEVNCSTCTATTKYAKRQALEAKWDAHFGNSPAPAVS